MNSLTPSSSPSESMRFTAGLFLYSGLFAQLALLLEFSAQRNVVTLFALVTCLTGGIAGGWLAARWKIIMQKTWCTRIWLGFLIHAAGMLLVIIASRDVQHASLWIAGVIASGWGQGVVFRAVKGKRRMGTGAVGSTRYRAGLRLSMMIVLAGICLLIPLRFVGMTGFPYAFALLFDVSLLGALYAKIVQHDSGAF